MEIHLFFDFSIEKEKQNTSYLSLFVVEKTILAAAYISPQTEIKHQVQEFLIY